MRAIRSMVQRLLAEADIEVDGDRSWDPRVLDDRFYIRALTQGSLGIGESYVDGWWDVEALDEMCARALRSGLDRRFEHPWIGLAQKCAARVLNPQSHSRAQSDVRRHYDLGNDLYRCMLDSRLVYTCGYWNGARNLNEAQEAKLELVCAKIGLRPGDHVLDIGCGWGSWARHAAERFGAQVTGITLSPPQADLGREFCSGLPVRILVRDYRKVDGRFDHVVSLGMFEHVGVRNYRRYMRTVHEHLEDDGLFLLHTIGGDRSTLGTDPWIQKYVFPNSHLPSPRQIVEAIEGLFVIEDWQNFGADYDHTLMAWWRNCERNWDRLDGRYDDTFRRRWKYYLLTAAGTFRARRNQVWQIVMSKRGIPGGYRTARWAQFPPARSEECDVRRRA